MWIIVIHPAETQNVLYGMMYIQVAVPEFLRQNLIGNLANSVFSGITPNIKFNKINFKDQRDCANTGKNFSAVSFQRFFQVFHTQKMFKNCFEHLL